MGNWTWRKDTIPLSTSSRVVISDNSLRISDVILTDSAYYSAEVQTNERRELFQFWLNVKGILKFLTLFWSVSDTVVIVHVSFSSVNDYCME